MKLGDEFFHEPTDEEYWSESHYLDAVDLDAGVTVQARVGFYPNRARANVFAYVTVDDDVYWVREESIPPENVHGLFVREEDWTLRLSPSEPPQTWRLALEGEATKTSADDPAGILAGRGTASEVALECTFESRHDPFYYSEGETFPSEGDADRYEVATHVEGTVDAVGEEVAFAGAGERDHSWGRRKWAGDAEWLWISGGFEDGTAYNHLTFWLADYPEHRMINGFWFDGERRHALTDATVRERPEFGPTTAREWMGGETTPEMTLEFDWAEGSTTVAVEPFVTTPVDWVDEERHQRAVLNRAPARQTRDGDVDGAGFLENMTQLEYSPDGE